MSITYTPATNFGAKDSLPVNDPSKVIKGSEFTTEFTAIQTAFGLAAPAASPTFTGTVTIASVDINGGTIDGVTIGGSSAGAITGTNLAYTGTLTGGTGVINIGSGQVYKDASGNVGIGTSSPGVKVDIVSGNNTSLASVLRVNSNNVAVNTSLAYDGLIGSGQLTVQAGTSAALIFGANAAEAMRITSAGNVGIGTSSPTAKLHILADTPVLMNNAAGTSEGKFDFADSGATLRMHNFFGTGSNIAFLTNSNGGAVTERMRIDSSGNLLVGTTTASAKLTVEGSGSAAQMFRGFATNASYTGQVIQSLASRNTTNESYEFLRCSVNGVADRLKIYDNGNVENTNNSYGSLSDIKLKENVVDASAQWDDIKGLRFRKYNFKEETGQSTHTQMGLIAQEAELVCPGIVKETTDRDQEGNDLGTTTKSIQYSLVYVKAVKALQEAMARIETLEAEVAALKGA